MKFFLPMSWRTRLARFLIGIAVTFDIAICTAEIPGYPDNVDAHDAREVAMLPRYCIHTQIFRETVPGGNNQAEIERWYSVMGKTFHAMHHYCWGLMKTNRAMFLARTQQDRLFYLNDSLGEFNFVINRAPSDFVLLPEILTRKGENLLRLGKADGIAELQRAMSLKPDYWPPYAVLSDYFVQTKEVAKARALLEKGLLASPGAAPLQRRMTELERGKHQPPAPGVDAKAPSPN